MKPHQERVVTEKQEFDTKRDKLAEFLKSGVYTSGIYATLPDGERVLAQLAASFRSETAELGAALAASQLVGLAVARYAVRLDALAAVGTDDLVRWVAPVIQSYLTGSRIS